MRDSIGVRAPSGRERLALAGLLVLAAGVRAFAWSQTAVLFNDGPIFLAMAEALRKGELGRVLAHPQHPLYPALVAAIETSGVAPETAAVGVSIAGGLLAVAAIFRIAWRRFGAACAWGSGAVVALHPWAVDFSADVMSDGLYVGLHLVGLAWLIELLERPGLARALAFGGVAGLAYWTRPEGLTLIAVALLAGSVWVGGRRGRGGRSLGWAVPGVALALGGLLVLGLRVAEWQAGDADALALSQKKSLGTLLEGGPSPEALARDRAERRARRADPEALPLPESSMRADSEARAPRPGPGAAGLLAAIARVVATGVSATRHELAALALVGALLAWRRRCERAADPPSPYGLVATVSLAIHFALLVLLVWGAGYVSRRHALAPGLALVPLASQAALDGLALVRERAAGSRSGGAERAVAATGPLVRRPRWMERAMPCALLVVVLVVAWGPRDLRPRRLDRLAERQAATWLAASGRALAPVAAQKRRTAYYAGARFVPLPDGRNGAIEDQLRRRRTGYVIIDEAKLADHVGLADGVGDWLVPIHAERAEGRTVLVLAFAPTPAH